MKAGSISLGTILKLVPQKTVMQYRIAKVKVKTKSRIDWSVYHGKSEGNIASQI